jgi:hypothetical protein
MTLLAVLIVVVCLAVLARTGAVDARLLATILIALLLVAWATGSIDIR